MKQACLEQTSLEQASLGVAPLQGVEAINFPIPEMVLRLRAADIVKVDQGCSDARNKVAKLYVLLLHPCFQQGLA